MRYIKKYANRKLYDTTEKKYISLDQLLELIKSGEEVKITDKDEEDITSSVIPQLLSRDKKENEVPTSMLVQLLRKGGGTIVDYAKKYVSLWQNALLMAEDEIDKVVSLLIKDKELSESEGGNLKKEILNHAENLRKWITEKVDQRLNEVFDKMKLTNKEEVNKLTKQIDSLTKKVEELENKYKNK
ncbi:MAG: hypothetical protein HQK76_10300 [Desulfobacterales bacterium]|nr:hypothetical protein [Desulfobacterales bacterium]